MFNCLLVELSWILFAPPDPHRTHSAHTHPSYVLIFCKKKSYDFIMSTLVKESSSWDLARLYLYRPAGSNPETNFDVGDHVVAIIDYGAKLDSKFGMRLKSCLYDGLSVINCK